MEGYEELIRCSNAFDVLTRDKDTGMLSHAYMVVSPDKTFLRNYLKIFAKVIMCDSECYCDNCKICKGIDEETLTDAHFYPKTSGDKILAGDVTEIVEEAFVRPYELDKKIFIIEDVANMNDVSQNKFLKTLEEPPKNVYLLIGASSERAVLPTVKSRVKKLEISSFMPDDLYKSLIKDCPDEEKLMKACRASDGTYGNALSLYKNEKFSLAYDIAYKVLTTMASSRDVLKTMNLISSSAVKTEDFLDALEMTFYDMMVYFTDERMCQNAPNSDFMDLISRYNRPSCIYAIERIQETKKKVYFNGNNVMILERLLLQILEGKYKWRKS